MSGRQPRGQRVGQRGSPGQGYVDRGGRTLGGPPAPGQPIQMASHPAPAAGALYAPGGPFPKPDKDVHDQEDALVLQTKGKKIGDFPSRPGYGTKGKPIVLRTNYFPITTAYEARQAAAEDKLYRYEIEISPELTRLKRKDLVSQLVQDPMFNGISWATDYGKILVTTSELDFGGHKEWKNKFTVAPPSGNSQQPNQGPAPGFVQQAQQRNTATVRLTPPRTYTLKDMIDYLRSQSAGAQYSVSEDVIQILNIILCKPPRASRTVASVGQNKFYPFHGDAIAEISTLGNGLQALRGYFSSVRPAIGRLLVNINVTSGAFYEPIGVIPLMDKFRGSGTERAAFIEGLKVEVKYIRDGERNPHMTKIKTICGFVKQTNPANPSDWRFGNAHQVSFQLSQGQNITVFDYFKTQRGITLSRPNLSVLNVGTKQNHQYIPPELCTVLPGQPYRAFLAPDQTSAMITFAARYPNQNAMSIAGTTSAPGNGLKLFSLASASGIDLQANSVQPFGFRVGTEMITVPGRVLDSPRVAYRGNRNAKITRGSWNLQHVQFHQGGKFASWQVFVISTKRDDGSVINALVEKPQGDDMYDPEALFDALGEDLESYGIQLGPRAKTQRINLARLSRENRAANNCVLEAVFGQSKEKGKKKVILVVLPTQDRWLYSRIKLYGDVQFGVHTINAIGKNLQKPKGQGMFFGNLALKFNVKGGGVSHQVPNTLMGHVGNNTILFGIDVTHPSPQSAKGAPSIACVVANTDSSLFHWPASVRQQTGRQEMVDNLKDMVIERMNLWRKKNGNRLPDRVVIYRDGVSEGQFKRVLEEELPFFEEAYEELYKQQPKPKTAIIIVGKRHHTRFYPTTTNDADANPQTGKGSWNTEPGTVVDRGIVGRVIHEFYMQAHQGLQGTVRPAHYSVIKDDIGFSADELERFTLNLCYYFSRCTKAVSICPPAYYADLAAERGRAYLYSTLQESHSDDASSFNGAQAEWTRDVHADIAEDTWYI